MVLLFKGQQFSCWYIKLFFFLTVSDDVGFTKYGTSGASDNHFAIRGLRQSKNREDTGGKQSSEVKRN